MSEMIWVNPKVANWEQRRMHGGSAHDQTLIFPPDQKRVYVVCERIFYRDKPTGIADEIRQRMTEGMTLPVEGYHWDEQGQEFYLHDTWELT
jgi:hypothetical protein